MIAWLPLVATAGILQAPAADVRSDAASIAKALGYWVSLCDDLAKGMTKVVLQHDEPVFEDLPGAGAQASSRADSRVPPLNTRKVSVVLFAVNPRDRILRNKLPWSTLPIGDWHTEKVELGVLNGRRWFGNMAIFQQEFVRKAVPFKGGDDRLALLARGLGIEDRGSMTGNS